MKKIILFVVVLFSSSIYAQVDISGGMGISFVNNASLTDYLNIYFPSGTELGLFNSSIEFFVEGDYSVSPEFQIGIEYAYQMFSHNAVYGGGSAYDLSYGHHKPSLLAYYVIAGPGYKFKFGGGIGFRYTSLEEKILSTTEYSTSGFGALLRAQGNTLLGGDVYINIGLDLRYDLTGEPNNGDQFIVDNTIDEYINLNSLSVGVRVGISYYFN